MQQLQQPIPRRILTAEVSFSGESLAVELFVDPAEKVVQRYVVKRVKSVLYVVVDHVVFAVQSVKYHVVVVVQFVVQMVEVTKVFAD